MSWVRVDDAAPHHPKLLGVGPEAAWLWIAGLAYANRQTTDGLIAREVLHALYPYASWTARKLQRLVAELVRVDLWEVHEGGWLIHDYAEYQEPALRAFVEARRESARVKKRLQRDRQRQSPDGRPSEQLGATVPRVSPRTDAGRSPGDIAGDIAGDRVRDPRRDATGDAAETHSGQPGVSRPPVPPRSVPPRSAPSGAEVSTSTRRGDGVDPRGNPEKTQRVFVLIDSLRTLCPDAILLAGADTRPIHASLAERLNEVGEATNDAASQFELLARWYAAGSMAWRRTPLGLRELGAKPGMLAEHIGMALRWDRDGRPAMPVGPTTPTKTPGARQHAANASTVDPLVAKARLRRR